MLLRLQACLMLAAGVVAGWSQLGTRKGIHFVEDLHCADFMGVVSEVLGAPVTFHDPSATEALLSDRRVIG